MKWNDVSDGIDFCEYNIIQSDVAFAFVTVSIVYFQHLIIFPVKHTFYTKITEVHFLWFLKFYILSFYNFFREKNL